ncbi:hypothetical protein QF019_006017 [Pseudomonas frederiksbergensis]
MWCLDGRLRGQASLLQVLCRLPKRERRDPVGARLAREGRDAVSNQVRIPRPLTSKRAQPMYKATVATSMNVIATLILMSETPRMP